MEEGGVSGITLLELPAPSRMEILPMWQTIFTISTAQIFSWWRALELSISECQSLGQESSLTPLLMRSIKKESTFTIASLTNSLLLILLPGWPSSIGMSLMLCITELTRDLSWVLTLLISSITTLISASRLSVTESSTGWPLTSPRATHWVDI